MHSYNKGWHTHVYTYIDLSGAAPRSEEVSQARNGNGVSYKSKSRMHLLFLDVFLSTLTSFWLVQSLESRWWFNLEGLIIHSRFNCSARFLPLQQALITRNSGFLVWFGARGCLIYCKGKDRCIRRLILTLTCCYEKGDARCPREWTPTDPSIVTWRLTISAGFENRLFYCFHSFRCSNEVGISQ